MPRVRAGPLEMRVIGSTSQRSFCIISQRLRLAKLLLLNVLIGMRGTHYQTASSVYTPFFSLSFSAGSPDEMLFN
jgi:hypothetical protein